VSPRLRQSVSGSVLLEVVLALALFVGAATIISTGINASVRSVDRVRLQNHAINLAITVLSEMQMQIRPVATAPPEAFPPPFQDWTCQVDIAETQSTLESPTSLRPVEIIIRHTQENVVHRLTQLLPAPDTSAETDLIARRP
jgi:type II secretory pathway pseudopilin PulG